MGVASEGEFGESTDTFMQRVREYAGAPAAIGELYQAGIRPEDLREWLLVLAELQDLWQGKSRPLRKALRAEMPIYTLDRFPEMVRGWAQKISHLQQQMKNDPVTELHLLAISNLPLFLESGQMNPDDWKVWMKMVEWLPLLLNEYAQLVQTVSSLSRLNRKHLRTEAESLRELFAFYTRSRTGKPHFKEITTVVNAAYSARKLEPDLDQHALENAYGQSRLVKYFAKQPDPSAAAAEVMEIVRKLSASFSRVRSKNAA